MVKIIVTYIPKNLSIIVCNDIIYKIKMIKLYIFIAILISYIVDCNQNKPTEAIL